MPNTVTYKCPNCDSGLSLDPNSGFFVCEYCKSGFSQDQIFSITPDDPSAASQTDNTQAACDEFAEHSALYCCPSCGAEVMVDETTAATFCVYCHNPVVLSGKIDGSYRPDYLIPFSVDRERALRIFQDWCKQKKFADPAFFSQAQQDYMQGVYYPFWVIDAKATANLDALGKNVRTWRSGDYVYRETSIYRVLRQGELSFNDITFTALDKQQLRILNGIQPYDTNRLKPFHMSFLSGFLAEKRNLEKENMRCATDNVIQNSGQTVLKNSVTGYGSVTYNNVSVIPTDESWLHIMFPAWMLTYQYKGENYFFAINGDSGKVAGRVPVSKKKLALLFTSLAVGISGILIFLGWLL